MATVTDEFGQPWYDCAGAVAVSPISKRIMIAECIAALESKPRHPITGCRSTYCTTGDTFMSVTEHGDGTIEVYECRPVKHTFDYKRT
jgi:hypothetical protein